VGPAARRAVDIRKAKSPGAGSPPQTEGDRGAEDRLAEIEADVVGALEIGPGGLYQIWRAPCRYCWGTGHLYQWKTRREYQDALETALMRRAPRPHADGGFGYRSDGSPNLECPECCGLGEDRVRLCDLAQTPRAARTLLSQRELAERIGLSQNALWRRLKRLEAGGLILGSKAQVNLAAMGYDLTVFVMVQTRNHSMEWAKVFRDHVAAIPEVVEMHRIGGEWDYMLKIVTRGIAGYDSVYQRLTTGAELERVTGYFSMETMLENRLPNLLDMG